MLKEIYDYRKHGDFKRYYDSKLKRTFWLLGYATNITIPELYWLANEFAIENGIELDQIKYDEILASRWCKYFKVLYATVEHPVPENVTTTIMEDIWSYFNS